MQMTEIDWVYFNMVEQEVTKATEQGCRLKTNFDRVDSPDYRLKRKMRPSPALFAILKHIRTG